MKIADVNEKIADKVVKGYQKVEDSVVGGYKKMENTIVEGAAAVMDKCVEVLFTKENETVEEAKARLNRNNKV